VKRVNSQRSVEFIKKEFGLDISEKGRQQLAPDVIDRADLVIVIAEKHLWPDYLKESDIVFWDVSDALGHDDGFADDIYKQVMHRVELLVEEIG
jgi:protein-tyrosine-phosphatase